MFFCGGIGRKVQVDYPRKKSPHWSRTAIESHQDYSKGPSSLGRPDLHLYAQWFFWVDPTLIANLVGRTRIVLLAGNSLKLWPFWELWVTSRDPLKGWKHDLQRSGIKRSRIESPGSYVLSSKSKTPPHAGHKNLSKEPLPNCSSLYKNPWCHPPPKKTGTSKVPYFQATGTKTPVFSHGFLENLIFPRGPTCPYRLQGTMTSCRFKKVASNDAAVSIGGSTGCVWESRNFLSAPAGKRWGGPRKVLLKKLWFSPDFKVVFGGFWTRVEMKVFWGGILGYRINIQTFSPQYTLQITHPRSTDQLFWGNRELVHFLAGKNGSFQKLQQKGVGTSQVNGKLFVGNEGSFIPITYNSM